MSNEEIYYALWYHFNDGEKSTNAISKSEAALHRPKRKMRQNAVITYIFYNYVSSNSLSVLL